MIVGKPSIFGIVSFGGRLSLSATVSSAHLTSVASSLAENVRAAISAR